MRRTRARGMRLATAGFVATPLRRFPPPPATRARPRSSAIRLVRSTPAWTRWRTTVRTSVGPLLSTVHVGYGIALIVVALATATALGLQLGAEPGVFAPFLVAVTIVALQYGPGPAALAIAASVVAAYHWFLAPLAALAFDPAALHRLAVFRIGVFVAAAAAIAWVAELHRHRLLELERSRRQLRAFTVDDEIGLQVVDHDGRIVWTDDTTPALLGYTSAEWVGAAFAHFYADRALAQQVQGRLAVGAVIENVRATLVRKDGTTQDVLLNSNNLLGDASTPGAGVLIAVLPFKGPVATVDGGKHAVSALLARRRLAAAESSSGGPS